MNIIQTYPVLIPFIAMLLAEALKALIDLVRARKKIRFISPGGMPSGHSAFVGALVVVAARRAGIESDLFMISAVIALVVMYDAIHLRNEAGKHARILNALKPEANLEESLGHTHLQVLMGAVLGALIAFLLLG